MDQLAALVDLVRRVLGGDAIGAYLHGSAVLGGLRPTSDTDVLVVTAAPMTGDHRRGLVEGILPLSGPPVRDTPARPVELTVVVAADVRPWRYPPVCDFLYGEWERAGYEAGTLPARHVNAGLAVELAIARAADRPLFGPPIATLLDPVPPGDVARAAVAGIPGLLDDLAADTRNVLLTLARIWTTVETGRIVSKDEAAAWAMARLPATRREALRRARLGYLEGEYPPFDDLGDDLRATADEVVAQIRRAEAAGGPRRV